MISPLSVMKNFREVCSDGCEIEWYTNNLIIYKNNKYIRDMSKSDSDENSSGDEDFEAHAHLFKSSLDVGSHFIDINPEHELTFYNSQGTLFTQMTIKNVTSKAHVAYFVRINNNCALSDSNRCSHRRPIQLKSCPRMALSLLCISKSSISAGKINL